MNMKKIIFCVLLFCRAHFSHTHDEELVNIDDSQQPIHLTIVLNNNGSSQTTNSTQQLPAQTTNQQITSRPVPTEVSCDTMPLNMTKTQYTVIAMVKGVAVSSLPYLCPPVAAVYWANRILIYPFFVEDPLFAQEEQDPGSDIRKVDTLVAFPVAYHTKKYMGQIMSSFWFGQTQKNTCEDTDNKKN